MNENGNWKVNGGPLSIDWEKQNIDTILEVKFHVC